MLRRDPFDVRFSNRPFGVKRFQTIHQFSVDAARGLVLLFGIGTKALPSWDSKTRWNNLWGGLALDERWVQADIRSHLIRRPARDIIPPLGETRVSYAKYYNQARTHLSPNKDAPVSRAIQTIGRILPLPILGGLHHQYVRI